MAADVKNNAFLLGEATLMITPFVDDSVFELTPEEHSVGMIRNLSLSQESDAIELRKGIQQHLVDSKKSNVRTTLSAEVYEFTAQNLFYSLSVNRTAVEPKRGVLTGAAAGGSATITVESDPLPGVTSSAITAVGDIPQGATILIQRADSDNDYVLPVRVTAATTDGGSGEYTVTVAIPDDMSFPAGSRIWVVNEVPVGTTSEQDIFSIKATGTLANYERPVTLILPKVKIRRGFAITFDETNYGNMPFELDPLFLTQSELSGRLAEIGTAQQGKVYI